MKGSVRYISILLLAFMMYCCTKTWIVIPSKNISFTGMDANVIGFGHPVVFHYVFVPIVILGLLLNRVWSLRLAFFTSAFNVAWTIRNYIVLSACSGGICPEKQDFFHFYLASSLLAMIILFFVDNPRKRR